MENSTKFYSNGTAAKWRIYRMGRDGKPYNEMGVIIAAYEVLPPLNYKHPNCDLAADIVEAFPKSEAMRRGQDERR